MKLAVNSMVAATSALVAEALAFGRKGGLDTATMLEVISNSAVASPVIGYKTRMLVSEDFTPAFSVKQMMKELDIALSVARSHHCPLPLVAQIRQIFEAAYVGWDGDKDYFVLSKEYARLISTQAL
jgi:3-hydroxyisobutyrate dehydrogenase-like beta-hydroxyacid dehydrogenase